MAFWGVEVKPGNPVIHSCEKARGRLRISQATLGISDATKKSIVQCNVGKKSPVLLCALLPSQTESCQLDLEFEEADDVVFSVIGPRSVYLSGYYVRQSQQSSPQSDSESYGVDIQDSQTEESSYRSDDDEYEDSFIDDDEPQNFSPSPVSRSKVVDETASESDKPNNGKARCRRLKKNRHQVIESDDASSNDSEDDDGYLLSVFRSKKTEKTTLTGIEANIANQNVPTNNGKDQMHSLGREKPKKKRKERAEREKTCEVEIYEGNNIHREDKRNEVEASNNLDLEVHQLPPELDSEKCRKSKKRRKQLQSEGTFTEENDVKSEIVAKDDNFEQSVLHADSKKDVQATNGGHEQQIDNQPEKKIKKTKTKKKKDQGNGEPEMGLPDTAYNQEMTPAKSENQTSNAEPTQNRTLSNGLIIEEVANGPPDGKVASRGKKVKIFYTAFLKENGHIFDSNVGKSPCKFRIGSEGIIDGWNLGIEGMHVGDNRRLIVPPSMGYGEHGAGENVPPQSWLVYDVELAGVYK